MTRTVFPVLLQMSTDQYPTKTSKGKEKSFAQMD
ncbi:hypothetical protein NC652_013405 [Populus alba x Populus x berolinensis]|uniref:Uncharacterized protein n=1 Tax=Populus alba x Populus x berolinensis TaxID=444605 RepID=A0AAD6QUS7_9ROSI|nr:hypothetical protein NC652_013405 [Populus alba x Populus x berolinensis]KAJ6996757.1 hypothetical protein NC653_013374 [Populus alba x Populus x berolinensis]